MQAPDRPSALPAGGAPAKGAVRLRGLAKTYPGERGHAPTVAVKGVDLEIEPGEFMVLVGPSGCGKSTTLRMVAGLEEPSAGSIEIGGRDVVGLEPKERGIAMVFQNYALYPHMSVFNNLAFGLKLAKRKSEEIRETVTRTAGVLGLEAVLHRKPNALSGGQRQRVALGRAIVRDPAVFLFDEPLSNLDAKMRVQMRAEISQLHARLRSTMIYVTHDQVEAMTMGDRICVMNEGAIMQVADPLTLYREPANVFVAGFIGSPPMNLVSGTIQGRAAALHFVGGQGPEPLDIPLEGTLAEIARGHQGRPAVLGIRPEHLVLTPAGACHLLPPMTVELAEPTGAESILYLRGAWGGLSARIAGDRLHKTGDNVSLHLPLDRIHLFDAETGLAIGRTSAGRAPD